MVRKCLEELLGSVREAAEEHGAQTANIQSCGPFKLQLADVVADDSTAVLQKQLTGLKQITQLTQKTSQRFTHNDDKVT